MFEKKSILISIREVHFKEILAGRKKAEIRRVAPQGIDGLRFFVYIPSPIKVVKGFFVARQIYNLPVDDLWATSGYDSALSKVDFFNYLSGKSFGYSIHFDCFTPLCKEIHLSIIKSKFPRFHPPQSFQYLPGEIERFLLTNA